MNSNAPISRFTAVVGSAALVGLLALGIPSNSAEAQEQTTVADDTVQTTVVTDSAGADSAKWGHTANQNPEEQNPPGYRGMERPVNVFPADSGTESDSAAAADATSRINQSERQDTADQNQNPPGYRGMERPVGTDSAGAQQTDTTVQQDPVQKKGAVKKKATTKEKAADDSAAASDSVASGDATSRVNQSERQDTADQNQNPPGYRGMERPAALDSIQQESSPDTAPSE